MTFKFTDPDLLILELKNYLENISENCRTEVFTERMIKARCEDGLELIKEYQKN